jgi:Predicted nucleoside-diphosphate-sugar epimerases
MDELILVDGATGFVGSNLVEYLTKKGYNVRASGRNIEKLNDLEKFGAEVVRCDLLDKSQIKIKKFWRASIRSFTLRVA